MKHLKGMLGVIAAGLFASASTFADDNLKCKQNGCAPKYQTHLGRFTQATANWENVVTQGATPRVMVTLHGVAAPLPSGMEPAQINHCYVQMIAYPHGLTYSQAQAQQDELYGKGEYFTALRVPVDMSQLPVTLPFHEVFGQYAIFPGDEGAWTIVVTTYIWEDQVFTDQDGNEYASHCDAQVHTGGMYYAVFATLNAHQKRLQIDEKAINRMPVTLPGPRREPATVEDETPSILGAPPAVTRPEDKAAPNITAPSSVGAPR